MDLNHCAITACTVCETLLTECVCVCVCLCVPFIMRTPKLLALLTFMNAFADLLVHTSVHLELARNTHVTDLLCSDNRCTGIQFPSMVNGCQKVHIMQCAVITWYAYPSGKIGLLRTTHSKLYPSHSPCVCLPSMAASHREVVVWARRFLHPKHLQEAVYTHVFAPTHPHIHFLPS